MKLRLSTKLFAGFVAISVLFAAVAVINYQLSRKVLRNSQRVERSQRITGESTTLLRNIIDMETGFRGFLLLGDETLLEYYYEGERNLLGRFAQLRNELPLNTPQYNRMLRAQRLYQQWTAYSHLLISEKREALRRNPRQIALEGLEHRNLTSGLTGKVLMDQIRVVFAAFEKEENSIRMAQRQKLQDSIRETRILSVGITLVTIFLGLLYASYLVRQLSRRIRGMVTLSRSIADGDYTTTVLDTEQDELTELADSLNVMSNTIDGTITQLERRNQELDQFAYVVSHDLKAPLRGIETASRWIEEDMGRELPEHIREFLLLMRTRVGRMENLISGILELARVGRTKQAEERVNVRELLQEILDSLAPPEGFKVELPSYLPTITTNRVQLQQVFSNLISNALKYHHQPEQGLIRIGCREERGQFMFSVQDNGPGISPEYHERIFVIFQTLTERDTLESTGVGLAIVKKIVERRGGTIRVESAEGQGATFLFTWPKEKPRRTEFRSEGAVLPVSNAQIQQ
ncbi:His Kinase A (phospho-acceptor) domain-containing protein [Hymenobacter gelipurpurascens]|uniref:histidine kinase n=1 Tax=Hymenobacter gelipurpurascens TaxID=89968 RepID=A0A212UA08_9BACT|nr:ATP-binding protein [Hymenobacter gelipurpurascens]SNC74884.1 His Kinase A (phospho-acceptor) domain-containing protein [Hymenobacter gelipurpurascens]